MSAPFGDWGIEESLFCQIVARLPKGGTLLELGSGQVSSELSKVFTVYSIEHDKRYLGKYDTNYIYVPTASDWYDWEILRDLMPKRYDGILIDGPDSPCRPNFRKYLSIFDVSKVMFIDDTQESYIKEFAVLLSKEVGREPVFYDGYHKKWAVI